MNETLGDLLIDYPAATLRVHLGAALPSGVPSLDTLAEIAFQGYTPAVLNVQSSSQDANGFSILTATCAFTCTDANGFSSPCLWVVSSASGVPVLLAFQPVPNGAISLTGSGTLTLNLSVTIFAIPAGF